MITVVVNRFYLWVLRRWYGIEKRERICREHHPYMPDDCVFCRVADR